MNRNLLWLKYFVKALSQFYCLILNYTNAKYTPENVIDVDINLKTNHDCKTLEIESKKLTNFYF